LALAIGLAAGGVAGLVSVSNYWLACGRECLPELGNGGAKRRQGQANPAIAVQENLQACGVRDRYHSVFAFQSQGAPPLRAWELMAEHKMVLL
jgi:hypothetical protein